MNQRCRVAAAILTAALFPLAGTTAAQASLPVPHPAQACQAGVGYAENWIFNSTELAALQANSATAPAVTTGVRLSDVFALSSTGIPGVSGTQPVDYFKSYADFQAAVKNGTIPSGTQYVAYDNESWPQTPPAEKGSLANILAAERGFTALAHSATANGRAKPVYHVILTPAQDILPGFTSPTAASWSNYVSELAGPTASYLGSEDIFEIQAQPYENASYGFPFLTAVRQAVGKAATQNPAVNLFVGISTSRAATPTQMYQDWSAVNAAKLGVAGYWLNITGNTVTAQDFAGSFLRKIPAADGATAPSCPLR